MKNPKKILFDIFSVLLILAVFYFLGKELLRNWKQISSYSFQFNWSLLLFSSFLYALAFFIFAAGWYLILYYLKQPIRFIETILYFFITQPAKYVPGKIWIAVMRMKFCKPHGVPNSITLLTTGIEGVMEIFAGIYISIIAILQTEFLQKFSLWWTFLLTALGLTLLVPEIFYFFINLYLKIVKQETLPRDHRASFYQLLFLQITYLAGIFLLGLSQAFFLQSFVPIDIKYLPVLISIGGFSHVASILAVFTPSGLGVREGVWYLALKSIMANHIALIYSFVSRLWTIVIEALLLFMCLPILWLRKNHKKTVQKTLT